MNSWIDSAGGRSLKALMDVSMRQHAVAAANIANIDTPGYRARQVDFRAAFEAALAGGSGAPARTQTDHLGADAGSASASHVYEVRDLPVRNDGNNVSIEHAMLNLAGAEGRYRAAVELLRKEHQLVAYAISDGREG